MKKVFMLVMVLCLVIGGIAQAALEDGLLGYWPLDGDGADLSGAGRHTMPVRGPGWAAGLLGQALESDDDGGHLKEATLLADSDWMNGLDALTISVWVKSDVYDYDNGFIIFNEPSGNDDYGIRYDAGGASWGGDAVLKMGITVTSSVDSVRQLETSDKSQTTEWQHVVMTWERGRPLAAYLDGVLDIPSGAEPNHPEDITEAIVTTAFGPMIIGEGGKDGGDSDSWDGLVDEVSIWGRQLSAAEVATLFNGGTPLALEDNAYHAQQISPADGAIDQPLAGVDLVWDHPAVATPQAIVSYNVYFSTILDEVVGPDPLIATSVAVDATLAVATGPLEIATVYWWRVDGVVADGNTYPGLIRSLEGMDDAPVITLQPEDIIVVTGCDSGGGFTVAATSDFGTLSYEWFDELDVSVGTGTSYAPAAGEDGDYYCVVTNSATAQEATSQTAAFITYPTDMLGGLGHYDLGNPNDTNNGWALQSSSVDGDTVNMVASGNDMWNNEDEGRLVAVEVMGDYVEVIAKVTILGGPDWDPGDPGAGDGWIKAGVTIRDTLAHNSQHLSMYATSKQGVCYQGRRTSGGSRNLGANGSGQHLAPVWLKLVRQGNTVTGYQSDDGVNWILGPEDLGGNDPMYNPMTLPIDFTGPVYVGVVGTNHGRSAAMNLLFEHVQIRAYGAGNPTPADEATDIDPTSEIVLEWDASAIAPCPVAYDVRVDDDPNLKDVAPVRVADPMLGIAGGTYGNDATIYWSVEVVGGAGTGSVWSFDTIKINPDITAQPEDTFVPAGQNASFTIAATNADSLQWYGPAGAIGGATGATLTLTGVGAADEGAYYCVATNTNGDKQSDSANLDVGFLIHHWPLDEIAGTEPNLIVEDVAGDLDGVPAGEPNGVGVVPGIIGNAYDLNNEGMLGYIDIDDSIGKLSSFSVSVWLNYHDDIDNLDSIMHHDGWTTSYMHFHVRPDGRITNNVSGTGSDLYSLGNLGGGNTPGTWYHVVMTYDVAAGQRIYYLDGAQDAVQNRSFIPAELFPGNIGAYNNDPGNRHWDGLMDDFRIYDYPLSRAEVAALYHAVFPDAAICVDPPEGDLDGDCEVTLNDFAIWAISFGWCDLLPVSWCP